MEISVLHSISWAHEAPWLLQLLQDVCTSCAACAAALEGCSGDQPSGLRLLQPREQSCRHVLQLDVMLCMPVPATGHIMNTTVFMVNTMIQRVMYEFKLMSNMVPMYSNS